MIALGCGLCLGPLVWAEGNAQHAIIISFDGLRPDAITQLGPTNAPHFYELMREGAFTLNARTDPDWTVTMPNHACMLTGRGVDGPQGHQYTDNQSANKSIHKNKGSYVASIFDVAREHGLSTGFFASKLKFLVFLNSYGEDKAQALASRIDVHFLTAQDDELTLNHVLAQIKENLPALTFIHFAGPDKAGHHHGWSLERDSVYLSAVKVQDFYLGKILEVIHKDPSLARSTMILITSDHGGRGTNHGDINDIGDYQIPLIIWGKGVAGGMDLYKMNKGMREDPKDRQVPYSYDPQPIRNGDVANIALHALGLPLVPGSTIGNPAPVRVNLAPNEL